MVAITVNKNTDWQEVVATIKTKAKKGNKVFLLSEEELSSWQETEYLKSDPVLWAKIEKGFNTPLEECVKIDEL
ncbi:MAG: hypothetical protein FWB72_03800 [Firmicutes bacterium]|nr:hypothetical protein [Bacillota bacterium]